jgi:hypothetical protein
MASFAATAFTALFAYLLYSYLFSTAARTTNAPTVKQSHNDMIAEALRRHNDYLIKEIQKMFDKAVADFQASIPRGCCCPPQPRYPLCCSIH